MVISRSQPPLSPASNLGGPGAPRSIGEALGEVDKVDVDNGRVRVKINMDEPLQFERRASYANGDIIKVKLQYEELHRHCYTCKRISHEEGTCPNLTPTQREENMINRLKQKEMEDLAAKEAFSYPTRGMEAPARLETYGRNHQDSILDRTPRDMNVKRNDRDRAEWSQRKDDGDLRNKISNRRDTLAKNVWNRLDKRYEEGNNPRDRERYHPYRQYPRENLREIRGGLESFNNRGPAKNEVQYTETSTELTGMGFGDSKVISRSQPPLSPASDLGGPGAPRSIGEALGEVDKVDVDNGRVRVKINMDEPLQFERRAGYANGDVIKVKLQYEELHRHC
ncbi:hypothetical protein F2Q69_00020540 [Brassica cretica]|uniref:Zinc knuckle CX2CX4HX4C domain-containing protein n=1 Tax=Brassica cretica TaxID=69181 RepID=A0A8S9QBY9_BRACR|nr:hypothetical protein F2Q69_00020540 [Brassica cretica]